MPINLLDSLSIKKKAQNVARDSFPDLEAAVAYNSNWLPSVFHAMLESTGEIIVYNEANVDLGDGWGKWRPLSTNGTVDLSNYYNRSENDLLLSNKVDKEDGKSLLSDTEIERLATLNNYDDSTVVENINNNATAITELQTKVGTGNLTTTAQNVIDAINEVKTGCETESTRIAEQVQTNTDAIAVLNGTENGSVYKQTQSALTSAKLYTDNALSKLNTTSAIVVDEKPSASGNTVTYLKNGEVKTATSDESIANAWFYYFVDSQLMQTRFVFEEDGTTSELTIASSNQDFDDYVNKNYDILSVTYTPDVASVEKVVTVQSLHDLNALIKTSLDEKVAITNVVNDLLSTSETAPLSANQGRVLNEKVNTKLDKTFAYTDDVSEVAHKNVMTNATGEVVLSAFDDTLSSTSSNAPQTKVVLAEVDKKVNIDQGVDNANKLLSVGADGNVTLVEASALGNSAENISYTDDNYPTYTNVDIAIKEILTRLDWVDVAIESFVVSPNQTQYEYGETIPAGTLTFSWLLNKPDITTISLTDMSPAITDVSCVYNHNLSNTKSLILTVSDGKTTVSKTIKISFDSKIYWGSATIPEELTSEWVLGLTNSKFATSKTGTYSFSVNTNEYAVICLPTSFGNISEVYIGGFATGVISVGQLNFTNASGGQKPYTVYRLEQHSLGAFSMDIK